MAVHRGRPAKRRAAENQAVFRELNERVDARVARWPQMEGALQRVLCECSLSDCVEYLGMTVREYQDAHRTDAHFAVAPGHNDALFERVAEKHERYWVVEKWAPLPREDAGMGK
jgi:hypothetical protein